MDYDFEDLVQRLDRAKDMQKKFSDLEKEASASARGIEQEILDALSATGQQGAKTTTKTISITQQTVPSKVEWDQVYAYIKEHDAFDLLQKRLAITSYKDRLEIGEDVPGVTTRELPKLSVRKR